MKSLFTTETMNRMEQKAKHTQFGSTCRRWPPEAGADGCPALVKHTLCVDESAPSTCYLFKPVFDVTHFPPSYRF